MRSDEVKGRVRECVAPGNNYMGGVGRAVREVVVGRNEMGDADSKDIAARAVYSLFDHYVLLASFVCARI